MPVSSLHWPALQRKGSWPLTWQGSSVGYGRTVVSRRASTGPESTSSTTPPPSKSSSHLCPKLTLQRVCPVTQGIKLHFRRGHGRGWGMDVRLDHVKAKTHSFPDSYQWGCRRRMRFFWLYRVPLQHSCWARHIQTRIGLRARGQKQVTLQVSALVLVAEMYDLGLSPYCIRLNACFVHPFPSVTIFRKRGLF